MEGSPKLSLSWPEFRTWLWTALAAGILAAIAKFIELGNAMDLGSLAGLWPVAISLLTFLASLVTRDTRPESVRRALAKRKIEESIL